MPDHSDSVVSHLPQGYLMLDSAAAQACRKVMGVKPSSPAPWATSRQGHYPPLERHLSLEVEAMLPALVGTLAMLAGQAMKLIDSDVINPGSELWERVLRLMELLL
jgi:Domain of unknown function (DUF1931)